MLEHLPGYIQSRLITMNVYVANVESKVTAMNLFPSFLNQKVVLRKDQIGSNRIK
jgi:hypothetical protein